MQRNAAQCSATQRYATQRNATYLELISLLSQVILITHAPKSNLKSVTEQMCLGGGGTVGASQAACVD